MTVKIIAEIGINHNGSLDVAKKLIDIATFSGCDFVKFQKRTPDLCVPENQKSKLRETPWGNITYLEYKKKIEFEKEEYDEIDDYCKNRIRWFASVWDVPSCDFMSGYSEIAKIPSALITNLELCKYARSKFKTLMISTGMSDEKEIEECVEACNPDVIFHTNSTYPCPEKELNLRYIEHLKNKYPGKLFAYSGHEFGLATTFATVPMGIDYIERHICLNRADWGSDMFASVEPQGLIKLVQGIRNIEAALGVSGNRVVSGSELKKRESLRS